MKKITNINTALKLFEEASIKQAEATEQGDYKTANKYYDIIIAAATFLKSEKAIDNLMPFLYNPSIGVRLWAACYLLSTHAEEGIKILEEIAKTSGIHSLTAETTLSEWKKGNLEF